MEQNNKDTLIYKIAALVIFIVLAVFIVLVIVSTALSKKPSGTTPPTPVSDTTEDSKAEKDTEPQETSAQTDIPDETKAPTETQIPQTTDTSPVSAPDSNIGEELAGFLAGFPDTVLSETEDAGKEYIDKIVFLGDSTTYGLRFYEMLEGGKQTLQVWTPSSGTLTLTNASFATIVYPETGEELTIKAAVENKKPEYLVITLGVNGISIMDEKYFKSEYKKIIESVQEVSPDTKIICQSMFPVARSYGKLGSINNDKIRNGNRWIVEVAEETGVKFVDTYSVLADSEGWLPESYHNGDGMHLNADSYTIELNNLRTHAYQ